MDQGKTSCQRSKIPDVFSLLILTVSCINACHGYTPSDANCTLSIPNNRTLFGELAEYFQVDSTIIILEYSINFNVSSNFSLVNQSSADAFQPWKWYRTQGLYTSYLLRSYDKYFGILFWVLSVGVRKVSLHIDVDPPDCLNELRGEALEETIRTFLLKDFDINGTSWKKKFTYSDDVEICTAKIGKIDRLGKLIFGCCGYNSEESLTCQEISTNEVVKALNIVLLIWTVLLVLCFPCVFVRITKVYGNENYTYRIPQGYGFKFNFVITRDPKKLQKDPERVIPEEIVQQMEWFTSHVEGSKKDEDKIKTVSVKTLMLNVSQSKLFNKYEKTHSKKRFFNWLLNSKPKHYKVFVVNIRRFVLLLVLVSTHLAFYIAHLYPDSFLNELLRAYKDKKLDGPFYFKWGQTITNEKPLVWTFLGYSAGSFVIYFICMCTSDKIRSTNKVCSTQENRGKRLVKEYISILEHSFFPFLNIPKSFNEDENCKAYCAWICFIFLSLSMMLIAFVGINFVLHSLIMILITIIVEVNIYSAILKFLILALAFIFEFVHDLGENDNPLKEALINVFKHNPIYSGNQRTMHTVTTQMIDDYLSLTNHDDERSFKANEAAQVVKTLPQLVTAASPNFAPDEIHDDERSFKANEAAQVVKTLPQLVTAASPNVASEENVTKSVIGDLKVKGSHLYLKLKLPCFFVNKDDIPSVSKKFLSHCSKIDCFGVPKKSNAKWTGLMYFLCILMMLTGILGVGAYGHFHHITDSFFLTFVTSFIALVIKRLYKKADTTTLIDKDNRKFFNELKKAVTDFEGEMRVIDFKDTENVQNDNENNICLVISRNKKVNTDKGDKTPVLDQHNSEIQN